MSTLFDVYSLSLTCSNFCVQPFQPTPAPVPTPLAGWMSNPSTVTHPAVSGGGAIGLGAPSIPGKINFLFLYWKLVPLYHYRGQMWYMVLFLTIEVFLCVV
jgi:hypothetical protein